MSTNSKIEWTQHTWNPVTGCTKVSQGCKNCYAETFYERFNGKGSFKNVICHEDRLLIPMKWKKPANVFVNSMSDLFHEAVPFEFITKVLAIMALTPRHTYQVLTKRHERMYEYFNWLENQLAHRCAKEKIQKAAHPFRIEWDSFYFPLKNLWVGVSIENQQTADERIPHLLQIPAAVRFLSCEPLLGPLLLNMVVQKNDGPDIFYNHLNGIDWVIVGGESGSCARPMHPDWVRQIKIQCKSAGIPFFFKQWGEYAPVHDMQCNQPGVKGKKWVTFDPDTSVCMIGKKKAGRVLDGKEYNEMPIIK